MSALGFSALIAVGSAPAGAYSSPASGVISTITTNSGHWIDSSAVDAAGNLVYVGFSDSTVRFLPAVSGIYFGQSMTAGTTYTIAGNGTAGNAGDNGPGPSAELNQPQGVAIDTADNVFIADTFNNRIRVVPDQSGVFATVSYTGGDIYALVGNGSAGSSGDGGTGLAASLNHPREISVDPFENLVIADANNSEIRVWSGFGGNYYGQSMTQLGVYRVAGNGTAGFSGDGGPATSAELDVAQGVSVVNGSDVLISDTSNQRIRVVAAASGMQFGIAMTAGDIYTIAGNGSAGYSGEGVAATASSLQYPYGATEDGSGNLIIADQSNNRIRIVPATTGTFYGQVYAQGNMYTLAGNGTSGNTGDGFGGPSAEVASPQSVAIDSSGNIIISSVDHVRIIGGSTAPESNIAVSSDVEPDSITATGASQWTAEVHNGSSTQTETNVELQFTIDNGALNGTYFTFANTVDQGSCTPSETGDSTVVNTMTCDLGSVGPNPDDEFDPPAVSVQVQGTKGLATDTVIHASVEAQSDFTPPFGNGNPSAESDITIVAPTPGTVETFASGQPGSPKIVTDKVPSASATIIAGFKIAKRVRAPGSFALTKGRRPAASAPLVTNPGTSVSLQRLNGTSTSFGTLCTAQSPCLGDVMQLAPISNQDDPKHPATLTLSWDVSVSTAGHPGTLFIVTDSNPNPVAVPTCIKSKLGYTNTPCIKKEKAPTTKVGWVFTVFILSSNDPSFGRR